MGEGFFKLRSSSHFQELWRKFFTQCGTDACKTLYQHITDIIFNDQVSNHFLVQAETEGSKQVELDYNGITVWYGMWVDMWQGCIKSLKHKLKKEHCTCLTEMNDVDPHEMSDESNDWMR